MPFWEHMAELRRRLVIVAAVLFLGSIAAYVWAPMFYDFMMAPVLKALEGKELETFGLRFKVGLYVAIILGSPIIIWQAMAFFLPAFRQKERKYVIPTFIAMVILFVGGVVFCYEIILTVAFRWMIDQAWQGVNIMPGASAWFQGASLLMIGFGIGFQIPIVIFYLVLFDIVPYKKMRQNWRVAYVGLITLAAIATPDWSPVTMGLLAVALIALYELSMFLARILLSKRIAAQKAAEAA